MQEAMQEVKLENCNLKVAVNTLTNHNREMNSLLSLHVLKGDMERKDGA